MRARLVRPAVARRMASPMTWVSGCSVASGHFAPQDSKSLHITGTASTLIDPCQFSYDTFFLAGDPYRELDDVTRSFDPNIVADAVFKTIPNDDALRMVLYDDAPAAWTGHEAAVNLGCDNKWLDNFSQDSAAMIPSDDAFTAWTEHNAAVNLDCNEKSLERNTVPYSRRFQATDLPPGVPLNVCFQLRPTTYWLRGAGAHVIANMLLDFLTAKATTTITKASHAKFSIKVSTCIDGSDRVAKLRMYSNDANRALALELQRRSGCGLVFSRFYREVGCLLPGSMPKECAARAAEHSGG